MIALLEEYVLQDQLITIQSAQQVIIVLKEQEQVALSQP
jgi:hypothetical protein